MIGKWVDVAVLGPYSYVIANSKDPDVPQDPFVYRGSLCPELKQKIEETFLTLQNVPDCAEFLKNVKSNKFVKMTSADYDVIRDLKKAKDARKKKK